MTQMSLDTEFNVLGCKVKYRPGQDESLMAKAVIDLVSGEIEQLKAARPTLRDTDVAVLVALKMATEKLQLEDEYKKNIFKLEESLRSVLGASNIEVN